MARSMAEVIALRAAWADEYALATPSEPHPAGIDRLGVVAGDRIAEYIWSHPGLPLRRSQRLEVQWALRRPLR